MTWHARVRVRRWLTGALGGSLAFVPAVALPLASTLVPASAFATPAAVSITKAVTTPARTNVRANASTKSASVGIVTKGTTVTGSVSRGWLKIASPTRFVGKYIAVSALAVAPTKSPHTANGLFGCTTRPQLVSGETSVCVEALQYVLNSWIVRTNAPGTQLLTVTARFGGVTSSDLKAFQKANKLAPTGKTDAATWNALVKASKATSATNADGISTGQAHLAFPSAIKLLDGRLMVVFRSAMHHLPMPTTHASMYSIYSSDGGYTWTKPTKITLPTGLTDTIAGLGIATSGPLKGRPILTTWSAPIDPKTGKNVPGKMTHTYVTIAKDTSGRSWGPLTDVRAAAGWNLSASAIVQVTDTDFEQSVYVFANNGAGSSAMAVPLTYDGKTFRAGTAAVIAGANQVEPGVAYDETNIVKLRDGRLLALVRDNPIASPAPFRIWESYSSDGGATWTTPTYAFDGSGSARPAVLKDGRIVVLYRHLVGAVTRGDMDAVYRISADGGATWGPETSVGVHSPFEMSYGTPIVNADGTVTFIYGSEKSGDSSKIVVTPNKKV